MCCRSKYDKYYFGGRLKELGHLCFPDWDLQLRDSGLPLKVRYFGFRLQGLRVHCYTSLGVLGFRVKPAAHNSYFLQCLSYSVTLRKHQTRCFHYRSRGFAHYLALNPALNTKTLNPRTRNHKTQNPKPLAPGSFNKIPHAMFSLGVDSAKIPKETLPTLLRPCFGNLSPQLGNLS